MNWRMITCAHCGRDEGGQSGIFEARDRGEPIERVPVEMTACPCPENPYVAVCAPGETVGKMVLKSTLPTPPIQPVYVETEWDL